MHGKVLLMNQPGALVISLDFELHWGVFDKRSPDEYHAHLHGTRAAIAGMLDCFSRYNVHATWATVGLLFTRGRHDAERVSPQVRPSYTRPELSPYPILSRAGASSEDDPAHFASDWVRRISQTPGQEIGTHTFSHYYCLEFGQTHHQLRADLEAAQYVAARDGITLRSIVFPRNQFDSRSLAVCAEFGLVSFRGNPSHPLYLPRADADNSVLRRAGRLLDAYVPLTQTPDHVHSECGLVNVPATRFLRPWHPASRHFERLKRRRIMTEMRRAARHGGLYHLWWHPHNFGAYPAENLDMLDELLRYAAHLRTRYGMRSWSMADAAHQLVVCQTKEES